MITQARGNTRGPISDRRWTRWCALSANHQSLALLSVPEYYVLTLAIQIDFDITSADHMYSSLQQSPHFWTIDVIISPSQLHFISRNVQLRSRNRSLYPFKYDIFRPAPDRVPISADVMISARMD